MNRQRAPIKSGFCSISGVRHNDESIGAGEEREGSLQCEMFYRRLSG